MNKFHNYINLMQDNNTIGVAPMVFTAYKEKGEVQLQTTGRYSFLFVLEGRVHCVFGHTDCKINKGYAVVVDKEQMSKCTCDKGTLMLEYETVGRMSVILKSVSQAFCKSFSEIVVLNEESYNWCENLLNEMLSDIEKDDLYYRKHCIQLMSILLKYPQDDLGTLYVPLYACFLSCRNNKECFVKSKKK